MPTNLDAATLRAAVAAGWDDGVRFAAEVLRSQVFPRESAREACIERLIGAMTTTCEATPAPDSAEWWRQVAQGLSVEIAKLKAARPRCEWRAYPNGPQCTEPAGHGLPHMTRSDEQPK